ncbi:ORF29 [callitrichine gammaherpesvirus 3]|uniref:Cytoplasmic envelopment protein 3 n=1 Tax=callitrichine gammaherpesvirus 3 TaxID=106331 RepID=Q993I1_9GAMA|nr:ORF29 [callitrichine gammaherpesvirus 3]AAK38237.1 ORF29 [callitrichine gammaherpesvirus 3]
MGSIFSLCRRRVYPLKSVNGEEINLYDDFECFSVETPCLIADDENEIEITNELSDNDNDDEFTALTKQKIKYAEP